MRRRSALALVFLALLATRAHAQRRPNIVLILTDDLDALLGTLDYTPNINALLRDAGMSFANAYVTNSVCCPSRSTLLRSQYTHSHRVYTNVPPIGGYQKFQALEHENSTLATWLHEAGYATALMGKYLNGYRNTTHVPPGWTDWRVGAAGNDYGAFNYSLNENGTLVAYGSNPVDYMTDVLARHAQNFIHTAVAAHQPFFLELATYAPHQPATPAPRHAALLPDLKNPGDHQFDRLYRRRVLAMQGVDELVKQLVDSLTRLGQLGNTYIFFTSDNGFHLGQHGLKAGKQTPYEEDIRVPLFIRGPGIKAGGHSSNLVANVDYAPTIAELAGAKVPDFAEGRSLVPLMRGQKVSAWRELVLVESYAGNRRDGAPMPRRMRADLSEQAPSYVALRSPHYLYVERRNGKRELYDLQADPKEEHNIADASPDIVSRFSQLARELHACAGSKCRVADAALAP